MFEKMKKEYKDEMNPFRRNPCKTCITKPVCNKRYEKRYLCEEGFEFQMYHMFKGKWGLFFTRTFLLIEHFLVGLAALAMIISMIKQFG